MSTPDLSGLPLELQQMVIGFVSTLNDMMRRKTDQSTATEDGTEASSPGRQALECTSSEATLGACENRHRHTRFLPSPSGHHLWRYA